MILIGLTGPDYDAQIAELPVMQATLPASLAMHADNLIQYLQLHAYTIPPVVIVLDLHDRHDRIAHLCAELIFVSDEPLLHYAPLILDEYITFYRNTQIASDMLCTRLLSMSHEPITIDHAIQYISEVRS